MALFEKGNNIGNRFTSENQPKKNGRKPSMYKQLKELTGKKVDYELSKEDYYKTIRFLLERSKGELNKIMADANREDSTTPIWVCNIISAIFRGIGDSKSPMYFIAVACAANIGLDYLFIGVMGLDAAGAALGTTIAQAVSVIASLTVVIKKGTGIKLRKSDLRPKRHTMKNILKVGVPVALQDGFIQISFIAITIFANQRGLNDAAAVGIVEKIIGILFLVPSSMLSTISALASQNIGAGKHDRARLTLRYVLCMTVGYGLVAATIVQFVSVPFVGLFTNDGAVQILGGQYLRSYAWDCVFAGVHFCLSGYFYAYGLSIVSFIHNSISIICARIPLSYYAATHFPDTLFPMGCAAPAGSIISIIICVGVLIWMNRHSEKYMGNNKSEV